MRKAKEGTSQFLSLSWQERLEDASIQEAEGASAVTDRTEGSERRV